MNMFLRWAFLSGFARALKYQCKWAPNTKELEQTMATLPGAKHMPGTDRQAQFNLLLAQSLQAAVQIFQGRGYGRARSVEMARAAFLENGSGLTRAMFAWWLRVTPDPVAQMKARRDLADRARALWGEGMKVDEVHGDQTVALHVTSCPFAEYFWGVCEPDLTAVLCAYDAQWMAQVNMSPRPVRVSRSGTLAAGADHCDFTFKSAAKQTARAPKARQRGILGHICGG